MDPEQFNLQDSDEDAQQSLFSFTKVPKKPSDKHKSNRKKAFHSEPFSEETLDKLNIYSGYLDEWLPVFLAKHKIIWHDINIFDFFAGPGYDLNRVPGSPVIALSKIESYVAKIIEKGLNLKVYLNDKNLKNYQKLLDVKEEWSEKITPARINVSNEEFSKSFKKANRLLASDSSANLIFADQRGFKELSEGIFKEIIEFKQTDLIFFISSSFIKRFKNEKSVQKYFPGIDSNFDDNPHSKLNENIINFYRELIPSGIEYHLSSFTLKKGSNIYGLIFGSKNLLGLEKFLIVCWNMDSLKGEANFNVTKSTGQVGLFGNEQSKIEEFNEFLFEKIKKKVVKTDKDVYICSLLNGFLPAHAKKAIRKLQNEGFLEKMQKLCIEYKVTKTNATVTRLEFTKEWLNRT